MKILQTNRFIAVLTIAFSVIFCFSEDLKADWGAVQNQSSVGKLYTLTVWAGGDLEMYTSWFSTKFRVRVLIPLGLSPSSAIDSNNPVDFCAEAISLFNQKDSDGIYISKVTNEAVLEKCRYLSQKAGKNDVIFVYMCCHGKTARIDGSNKRYHILFPGIKNPRAMRDNSNGIKRSDIIKALNPEAHRLTVLITDSCTYYVDNEASPVTKWAPEIRYGLFHNNRLWLLLRTNTGLIDWNSTSPYGGHERQGEYSSVYQTGKSTDLGTLPNGVFFDSFVEYCREPIDPDTKSFSATEFFNGLQKRQAAEFTRCKNDPTIRATDEEAYNNQPTQTLFDYQGLGYTY